MRPFLVRGLALVMLLLPQTTLGIEIWMLSPISLKGPLAPPATMLASSPTALGTRINTTILG